MAMAPETVFLEIAIIRNFIDILVYQLFETLADSEWQYTLLGHPG